MFSMRRHSAAFTNALILTVSILGQSSGWANIPAHSGAHPATLHRPASGKAAVKPNSPRKTTTVKKTTTTSAAKSTQITNPNAFIPYYYQGQNCYNHEQFRDAEKPLKISLSLAEKVYAQKPQSDQRKNLAIVSSLVGHNAFKLKKYTEASRYLKQALNLYSQPEFQADNPDAILNILLTLGQMAIYEGQYAQAQNDYQQALPLQTQKLGPTDSKVKLTRDILDEIAHIDNGPDYLAEVGPKVTHWSHPEQPITIFIADGIATPNWKPDDAILVQQAFTEWQQALLDQVHFAFVTNPQDADIVIQWIDRPKASDSESNPAKSAELRNGECQTQSLRDVLTQDDIVIALNDTDGKPMLANKIHHTALHEIGHALGLSGGHSRNPGDVLFPNDRYEDGRPTQLSARDIRTIQRLYASPPAITNPAGIHLVRYQQYANLIVAGGKAFEKQAYQDAANAFRNALFLYSAEPETRFWYGASLYQLHQYGDAIPYLMAAAAVPGKRQDEALKLSGYALIQSGEQDDKAGARANAEEKYRRAFQWLNQGLQTMPVEPDNKKAIYEALTWLNHRLAMVGQPIQWVSESPSQGSPKKKGWFSGFLSSLSAGAVPMNGPQ